MCGANGAATTKVNRTSMNNGKKKQLLAKAVKKPTDLARTTRAKTHNMKY